MLATTVQTRALILTCSGEVTVAHFAVFVVIIGEGTPRFLDGDLIGSTITVGLAESLEGKFTFVSIPRVHFCKT